jgi:predicted nucleotidyltransferase
MSNEPHTTPLLSNEWLHALVSELANENIIGIILGGSHVRGEATAYSDVDIACFISDSATLPRKRFIYRDGHLVNIEAKTVAAVRHEKPVSPL